MREEVELGERWEGDKNDKLDGNKKTDLAT